MALRGSLKDFSLPDIFQLITFSRKTGVLRITSGEDASGAVWFRDGEVFFAQSNWHHEPLGERLVAARKITPSALDKALGIRAAEPEGGRRLGQILVDEGYITEKVLEAFVQEQIQDTIFDLMRWESGEFDFELLPEVVDEDIGLTVSIENVIMEGSRRLEEWARIKKKVPSMDVVFKMATAPGEGTFEISLKPVEWSLLLLVDGTRSVAELARATGRTDFEVARILYGLFSAGLLEFAIEETEPELLAVGATAEEPEPSVLAEEVPPPAEPEPEPEPELELEPEPEPESGLEWRAEPEPEVGPELGSEAEPGPEPEIAGESGSAPESDLVFLPPTPVQSDEVVVREVEPEQRPEPEVPGFLAGPGPVAEPTDDVTSFAEMMGVVVTPPEGAPTAEQVAIEPPSGEATAGEQLAADESVRAEPRIAEPVEEEPVEVEFETDLASLVAEEPAPTPSGPIAGVELPEVEPEPEPEPEPKIEPEPAPEVEAGFEMPLSVSESEVAFDTHLPAELEPRSPTGYEPEASTEPEPDFSELLESLDEPVEPPSTQEDAVEGVLGEPDRPEIVLPEGPPVPSETLGRELEADLSAMTEEIGALTGARATRPQVNVTSLSEGGHGAALKRDEAVDKALVLKIIDGLKRL